MIRTSSISRAAFGVLLLSFAACGGGSDSPADICQRSAEVACAKLFECFTAEQLAGNGYTSEEDCVSDFAADEGCADLTEDNACADDGGGTFDGDAANECIDALSDVTCEELGGEFEEPAVCEQVCT